MHTDLNGGSSWLRVQYRTGWYMMVAQNNAGIDMPHCAGLLLCTPIFPPIQFSILPRGLWIGCGQKVTWLGLCRWTNRFPQNASVIHHLTGWMASVNLWPLEGIVCSFVRCLLCIIVIVVWKCCVKFSMLVLSSTSLCHFGSNHLLNDEAQVNCTSFMCSSKTISKGIYLISASQSCARQSSEVVALANKRQMLL